MNELIAGLRNGLIVSCQPDNEDPFNTSAFVAAFARAAEKGGASAIRTEGTANIASVRAAIGLPVIGFINGQFPNGWVCITPDFKDIELILHAGADMVALDVTPRKRPNGLDGIEFFEEVRNQFDVPLIADIATFEEGIRAAEMGADAVATTLSGYTEYTQQRNQDEPDFSLIEELARAVKIPVIAQGRIWSPQHANEAVKRGAYCVVAGSAITRPSMITKRFVDAIVSKVS
ncbi:MAG: N-acetylmannosamine-6-phosphate 2-epimerase [Bacteriovoracaceae bacterium]|nr:N-acetylmannosamine-6-phosphate 2-epimerase [Bacteroidota bacterium]